MVHEEHDRALAADETHLPAWLDGLRFPSTPDEVLDLAEKDGASEAELRFLQSLPAAVFTTEEGLKHALALMEDENFEQLSFPSPEIAEDGLES